MTRLALPPRTFRTQAAIYRLLYCAARHERAWVANHLVAQIQAEREEKARRRRRSRVESSQS